MNLHVIRSLFILILFILVHSGAALANSDVTGSWKGNLVVNEKVTLPLVVNIKRIDGKLEATLDSPAQGSFGNAVTRIEWSENKLLFRIDNMTIHYEGKLDPNTQEIVGTFIQGQPFPLSLKRQAAVKKSPTSGTSDIFGVWNGKIQIPGTPLRFILNIENHEGKTKAFAESPDQHGGEIHIDEISAVNGKLTFRIKRLNVDFEGSYDAEGKAIKGVFTQHGREFALQMEAGRGKKKE